MSESTAQVIAMLRSEEFRDRVPTPNQLATLRAHAQRVFGNAAVARDWLSQPAQALNFQRPKDCLASCQATADVLELIMRIEYGVYS